LGGSFTGFRKIFSHMTLKLRSKNGGAPVSSSNATIPKLHQSTAWL
jgi:hypothetical protein